MANTVKLKRSAVSGKQPTTADLSLGEVSINTYDGKLFIKKNNGVESIVELGTASSVPTENYIVDGDFRFWYEGTSQTSSGFGSDTMFRNTHIGSSKVHSRQAFSIGQAAVPYAPKYFSRTVVTGVPGAGNYVSKRQNIEDVTALSGDFVTLSFWAKADTAKNIAVEFSQIFGTGGAPSATVSGIGVTTINLSTTWSLQTVTVALPSIAGKTLGSDGNDSLQIRIWFEAGSDFAAESNSLGNQSGTFDIARVRLVKGASHGDSIKASAPKELELVRRHFQYYGASDASPNGYAPIGQFSVVLSTLARSMLYGTPMRSDAPIFSISGNFQILGTGFLLSSISHSSAESKATAGQFLLNGVGSSGTVGFSFFIRFANDLTGYFYFDARI